MYVWSGRCSFEMRRVSTRAVVEDGDAVLTASQLFDDSLTKGGPGFGRCELQGIPLGGDRYLRNLGALLRPESAGTVLIPSGRVHHLLRSRHPRLSGAAMAVGKEARRRGPAVGADRRHDPVAVC